MTMITSVISKYYYKLTIKYIKTSESCFTSYIMMADVLRNTVLKTNVCKVKINFFAYSFCGLIFVD